MTCKLFRHGVFIYLPLLLVLFIAMNSLAHAAPKELIMGLVAADKKEHVRKSWEPILEDMSKAIGITVKPLVFDDYASIIWFLSRGKAQMAWMGNKAALEAVDRAGAEIILQTRTKYGAGYYAHLITRNDSPYESVADVFRTPGDVVFGNGDPNSTSGFLVPSYYLFASKGIDPKKIFKRVAHNNHEKNFLAVVNGQVDVATNNSSALGRYKALYPRESETIRVIWTSPLIPTDPIVVRRDLPEALKEKVAAFFVAYAQPAPDKSEEQLEREKKALATRKWVGLKRSDDSQLEPIRKLELFKQKIRIERDSSLSAAGKTQRLKSIEAQLKALEK